DIQYGVGYVITSRLRLYKKPSTESEVIDKAYGGDRVVIAEDMDGWCRAWSLALEAHKLSVVRISEPAVFGGMDDVIALLGDADALELKKLFEAHGIGFPVKVYSAGRDAVGLRLV
ncbi:MAG: SH3 domain-containing protein, partial [Proteobacteria bacterium]|nr:SH3 domain-containing protein [Pseudomonadota bacterium]